MLKEIKIELEQMAALGKARQFHPVAAKGCGHIKIKGKKLVDFTNWDFLNLNDNKRFKRAAQTEIENTGIGASSSRLCAGTTINHITCEERIAKFLGMNSSLLFSSKNQAVLSLVTALATERDIVLVDELLQSPVIDASYLVNATLVTFRSNDLSTLEKELVKAREYRRKFVFIESVSPVTGKTAKFSIFKDLLKRYEFNLIVDESYALGAVGARGAGGCEIYNFNPNVFCQYGDLSLGLGGYGAFIAGHRILISYLVNRSKTFSNEVPIPQNLACAIEAAINFTELKPILREKIKRLALKLRSGLCTLGVIKEQSDDTPIVCFSLAKTSFAEELIEALFQKGFYAERVCEGKLFSDGGVVRLLINASHSEKDIANLLQALSEIYLKMEKG